MSFSEALKAVRHTINECSRQNWSEPHRENMYKAQKAVVDLLMELPPNRRPEYVVCPETNDMYRVEYHTEVLRWIHPMDSAEFDYQMERAERDRRKEEEARQRELAATA